MIAGTDFFFKDGDHPFLTIFPDLESLPLLKQKHSFPIQQLMKLQLRRAFSKSLPFLLIYWICSVGVSANVNQPNIVIIFTDDMGYGDIGPFGSDHPTPHLNRMAEEGMKLTDFYVSSTACTPSRSALLTGCYADRIEMGRSVVFPADERGLNPKKLP